jgi:hypothetical protein
MARRGLRAEKSFRVESRFLTSLEMTGAQKK